MQFLEAKSNDTQSEASEPAWCSSTKRTFIVLLVSALHDTLLLASEQHGFEVPSWFLWAIFLCWGLDCRGRHTSVASALHFHRFYPWGGSLQRSPLEPGIQGYVSLLQAVWGWNPPVLPAWAPRSVWGLSALHPPIPGERQSSSSLLGSLLGWIKAYWAISQQDLPHVPLL